METTEKKARIGVAISLDSRLGPSKNMQISSHVYQDQSVEEMSEVVDKLALIAERQQAKAEIVEFKEGLRIESKLYEDALENLSKLNQEYPVKVQATRQALEDQIIQIRHSFSHYKTVQKQQIEKENIATGKIDKVLSEMEKHFIADSNNHKATILSLKKRIDDITLSIDKRQKLIG